MSNFQEIKQLKSPSFSLLPAYQFHAIELKYKGTPYIKISQEIQKNYGVSITVGTIKWWFYKGGPLAGVYREYADQMIDMEMEETRDFIRGNVSKAARTLAQVMVGMGGPAQVMAAKEFLERGLGKVKDEVDLKHSGGISIAMLDVFRLVKEAKNELRGENQNNSQGTR